MNDACGVRFGERIRDLDRVLQRIGQLHAFPRDQLGQRLAGYLLHGDQVRAIDFVDVVDRNDVRVVQGGGGSGFLNKTEPPFPACDYLRR
jgi:hypothetical protein